MGNRMTVENMVYALDSVTWYNGLAEYVAKWKTDCPRVNGAIVRDETYCCGEVDSPVYDQLQVIWMICVELFGNCGTSPRTGWIEDEEGFCKFIDDITNTQQEHDRTEAIMEGGQSENEI